MATIDSEMPLIVITGPTASGKSGLALELAERWNGEIICADSRTIYRGMDIGTAKPTLADQARVPHHLLDIAVPGQHFSAHDFQTLCQQAIADIRARGKVPFIVGGTGLYIDSVVLDYQFPPNDQTRRDRLSAKTSEELLMMLKKQHIAVPVNYLNKRHLVHALMTQGQSLQARPTPDSTTYVVAIATDGDELKARIQRRIEQMFASGIQSEAAQLAERYGWESEAMSGNIYPMIRRMLSGEITEPEAVNLATTMDRRLAKRQITWLKRHSFVKWLTLENARTYIVKILTKHPG